LFGLFISFYSYFDNISDTDSSLSSFLLNVSFRTSSISEESRAYFDETDVDLDRFSSSYYKAS